MKSHDLLVQMAYFLFVNLCFDFLQISSKGLCHDDR